MSRLVKVSYFKRMLIQSKIGIVYFDTNKNTYLSYKKYITSVFKVKSIIKRTEEDKMNKEYAPVIIPTMNRINHLRKCINSLMSSPLAVETDIYISVDYPPEEKYIEGYQEVKHYVTEELKQGFKNIFFYIQTENLGPEKNYIFLREKSMQSSKNVYIFTEDDNIFSPAFLGYINWALNEYENDDRVLRVCGYSPLRKYSGENGDAFFLDHGCAWGVGVWRNKENVFEDWLSRKVFLALLKDKSKCDLLYERSYKKYWSLVEACLSLPYDKKDVFASQCSNNIRHIDYTLGLYMTVMGKYSLFPVRTLVCNNGYDGTGVNCGKDEKISINNDLYAERNYKIEKIISLQKSDISSIFDDKDNIYRAKRAKEYKYIANILGINAARLYRKIVLYIEYKKYILRYKTK